MNNDKTLEGFLKDVVYARKKEAEDKLGVLSYQAVKVGSQLEQLKKDIAILENEVVGYDRAIKEAQARLKNQDAIPIEDVERLIRDAQEKGEPVRFPDGAVKKIVKDQGK